MIAWLPEVTHSLPFFQGQAFAHLWLLTDVFGVSDAGFRHAPGVSLAE